MFRNISTPRESPTGEMIMPGPLAETQRHLRARQVLDIRDGQGLCVKSLRGVLWITQANDTDDIIVHDGQSFVLNRAGLALISAPIGPADIIIQPTTVGRSPAGQPTGV
jgi:hypothetical protein